MKLNEIMEFDHVVRVHADGSVTSEPDVWAPECDDDELSQRSGDKWTLMTGWTGQYGYDGPCMHPSEFIGGGMKDYILATPGLYVAIVVTTSDEEYEDDNVIGWAVAQWPDEETD